MIRADIFAIYKDSHPTSHRALMIHRAVVFRLPIHRRILLMLPLVTTTMPTSSHSNPFSCSSDLTIQIQAHRRGVRLLPRYAICLMD